MRLRLAPLGLTVSDESSGVQAGSTVDLALLLARNIGLTYGGGLWSEAQSLRFLLLGKTPKVPPLVVRTIHAADGSTVETITVMAHRDVKRTSVAQAFGKATGRRGAPLAPITVAIGEFVAPKIVGKKPPYPWTEWAAEFDPAMDRGDFRTRALRYHKPASRRG